MAAIIVAVSIMAVLGLITSPSVVTATAFIMEAMVAPAVGVAPAGPWSYAEEDAVVEISWPIKPIGRAGIWRILVIAPLADGWNADFDGNLSFRRRHNNQAGEQYCRSKQSFESSHI
jgi:hypothetical protein